MMRVFSFASVFTLALVVSLAGQATPGGAAQAPAKIGSEADYAALVDDTDYTLARQSGNVDLYQTGQRFRQLLAQRLAEAERRNGPLTEDDRVRIYAECTRDAAEGYGPSRGHAVVSTRVTAGPLAQESDARPSRPHPVAQSHQ